MFYKYIQEDNIWVTGNRISFPDGTVLSVDNKTEKDGWKWYDNPPQEYLDWLEKQNN